MNDAQPAQPARPEPAATQPDRGVVSLDLVAARSHRDPDLVGAQLGAVIVAVLVEAQRRHPGDVEVRLDLGSTAAGEPRLRIVVAGPRALATAAARELRSELDLAFVVREAADVDGSGSPAGWFLDAGRPQEIGFGAPVSRPHALAPDFAGGSFFRRWLDLAAREPGLRLELGARAVTAPAAPVIELAVAVHWPSGTPPLRAAALVGEAVGGRLAPAPADGPAPSLRMTAEEAGRMLSLPVAGEHPLPGIPSAPSRIVPVAPTLAAPASSRPGIRLGSARREGGRPVDVVVPVHELTRHLHILGNTGAGKSTLQAQIACELAASGAGCIVIDFHGHLVRSIVGRLDRAALRRTWLIEAGDVAHPVRINPFRVDDPVRLDIIVQDLVQMFYDLFDQKREGIVGPRFESMFVHGIQGMIALAGPTASLLDVPRAYSNPAIGAAIAEVVTEPRLVDFWRGEMAAMSDHTRSEVLGWFTSKFNRFANTAAVRAILGSGEDAFDPARAIDERRIILVDLSKSTLGEVASSLLGFLYLSRVWTGFLGRKGSSPFGVIVDEAHALGAGPLPSILSEGRKFGAAVTIGHQYLAQLDAGLRRSLDGNVGTVAAFRLGAADAAELVPRMGGSISPTVLSTQPDLHAILARTDGGAAARPHTLIVDGPAPVRPAVLRARLEELRTRTRRDLVEPFDGIRRVDPGDLARVRAEARAEVRRVELERRFEARRSS